MSMNTVSLEQHGNDYIRPIADLKTRPQIRSKEQLKDLEYHIELDLKFKPRIQFPHKAALSVDSRLKKK